MSGNNGASEAANGDGRPDGRDGPAVEAQRLFTSLLAQPAPRRNGGRSVPPPVPTAEPVAGPAAPALRAQAVDEAELRSIAVAALAATDRIAEVVGIVASQGDATSADLVELGQAIEQALTATNERMAALEQAVLGAPRPPADAMARLRARVRRASEGANGNGASVGGGPEAG